MNGGNEATQLLRKMINCRTLGIPFSPQLHMQAALDQPMAMFKVREKFIDNLMRMLKLIYFSFTHNRMHKNKMLDVESNHVQVDRDYKKLARKVEILHHWQSARMMSEKQDSIMFGQATKKAPKETIIIIAPRTTTNKARKKICHAQIAEQRQQQFGEEIFAVKWSAMHADYTLSFMVSIVLIQ